MLIPIKKGAITLIYYRLHYTHRLGHSTFEKLMIRVSAEAEEVKLPGCVEVRVNRCPFKNRAVTSHVLTREAGSGRRKERMHLG